MSNKAKKAKQAKLRNKQKTKQLNRVRGQVKNLNLSDKDALFYQRALANKETPAEFVRNTSQGLLDLLEQFQDIVDLYLQPEWKEAIKTAYPQVYTSIQNAGEYIKGVRDEILEAEERFAEEFKDLDNTKNSFLLSSPAMEVFSSIQENIETNIENLFATKKLIIDLYVELETKFPGVENDDNSEA